MSAFQQIARQFAIKATQTALNKYPRERKTHTITSTDSILILFDGRDQSVKDAVAQYALNHPKTRIEQFCLTKPETVDAESFSTKQTNWADLPNAEVLRKCNQIDVKLLVLFNPSDLPSLHYLAVAHPAQMKVATKSQFPSDADLVYDKQGTDFSAYMQQLEAFMRNILV